MRTLSAFRPIFLILALFTYLANGAQAHIMMDEDTVISVPVCNAGPSKSITITLPGAPLQEKSDTCCGDCCVPLAFIPEEKAFLTEPVRLAVPLETSGTHQIHPGSPLWPGAPPQGPPITHI